MPVTRVGAQATRTTAAHAAKTSTSPRRGTHSPSGSTSPSRTTALALEGFGAPIPAVTPGTGLLQGDSEDPPSEDELISSEDDSSSGGDDDDEARNTLLHHPNAVIANVSTAPHRP